MKPFALSIVVLAAGCAHESRPSKPHGPELPPLEDASIPRDWERAAISFDGDIIGNPPRAWHAAETHGSGTPGAWTVREIDGGPAGRRGLALAATNSGETFNLLLSDQQYPADVALSVRVLAESGAEDRGGGVVWRAKDENNYYIVRWNPLESNFRVYKVVDGKRTMLESVRADANPAIWHRIEARMEGATITVAFDATVRISATDATFSTGGKVGLWTKADASSSFDGLTVGWRRAR